MKALVTGGAGFIGHHLVRALVEGGHRVTVLDDLSTGLRSRLPAGDGQVELIEGDIRDPLVLDRAAAGCDVVFHLAALTSVARSVEEPLQTNDVNVAGTTAVMLAAARARVPRVVFASSSAVYGAAAKLPSAETDRVDPRSPYAVSKLAAESEVHRLGQAHGVETVVLRYFNVFGPGQDPRSQYAAAIPKFITAALSGSAATIYGDGEQSRDFVFVDDVVTANLLAASAPSAISGITCNVASGSRRSVLDLHAAIADAAGSPSPVFEPARSGEVRHSQADISLARRALGYRVSVSFGEAVRRTVESYRSS